MPEPATVAQQIAAIKDHSDNYTQDEAAFAEASLLWGGGHNEFGVFLSGEREVVARHGQAEAAVTLAQSPNGLFIFGVGFHSPTYGFGYAPSIWGEPFGRREDARRAAIAELLERLEEEPQGKRDRADLKRVCEQLRSQVGPRQQELFG